MKTLACVKLASFSYSTAQSTWTSIPLFPWFFLQTPGYLVCRRARGRSLRLTHRLRRRLSPLAVSLFSPLRACGCSLRLTRRLRVAATFSLLSRGSLVDVASPRRRLHVASPRRRTYSLLSWAIRLPSAFRSLICLSRGRSCDGRIACDRRLPDSLVVPASPYFTARPALPPYQSDRLLSRGAPPGSPSRSRASRPPRPTRRLGDLC